MSEFETPLPLQLRQREIHGIVPQLYTNLNHLRELIKNNFYEKLDPDMSDVDLQERMEENSNDNHALKISKILLWIATNHPAVLDDDSKVLSDISVECLYFPDSWDDIDELLPRDALMTLLCSKVCRNLVKFCGYMKNPTDLDNARLINLKDIRLAVGIHNVHSFCDSLNSTTQSISDVDITIHLRCGEVDLEDLVPLQSCRSSVCISNASDQDVAWVMHAVTVLNFDKEDQFDQSLYLTQSTVTAVGVEAIAKGLFETGIILNTFSVSSPHINYDTEIVPGFESIDHFCDMIQEKYNLLFCAITDQEYEQEFLEEVVSMISNIN